MRCQAVTVRQHPQELALALPAVEEVLLANIDSDVGRRSHPHQQRDPVSAARTQRNALSERVHAGVVLDGRRTG
jgi:hypothetical protein